MITSQYEARDQEREDTVTLIDLNEEEWFEFIKKLVDSDIRSSKSNDKLTLEEVEQIDINYCAPLCNNGDGFREYKVETDLVSIISGDLGKCSLRLWLGENGIRSTLMDIGNILNGDSESLHHAFLNWWEKIPLEPQIIGDTIMTKRTQEYGINHIQLWLKSLNKENPPSAIDRFAHDVKLWAQAHELFMDWQDRQIYRK